MNDANSVRNRVNAEAALGLIVDVQQRLFPVMHESEGLKRKLVTLIEGFKLLGVPFCVSEQYPKGLGPTVEDVAAATAGITPMEKMEFSCMANALIRSKLLEDDERTIIVAGIETHVCVQQTVLDAMREGLRVYVCADAVSSRSPVDARFALEHMRQYGAVIGTVESLLFELCHVSGTDTFRALSKLVK